MTGKALLTILVFASFSVQAAAQQESDLKAENFILTTNPPGATVHLNGEYELIVNTPANLPADLFGKYKVKIARPGYESWSGELSFMPGSPGAFNVDLSRKTRYKAGLRSLFIPGWGQHYSGNTPRGAVFTVGVLAAAGGLLYADKRFHDRRDDYNLAYQNYLNAPSVDEQNRLFAIYSAARESASNAERDRARVFYVGLGLWIYNIFDSIIFFPEGSAYYPVINPTEDGGANLSFVIRF